MKFKELINEDINERKLTAMLRKIGFTKMPSDDDQIVYGNKDSSSIFLDKNNKTPLILTLTAGQKLYNNSPDSNDEFNIKKTKFDAYVKFKTEEELIKYLNKYGKV